MTPDDVLGYYKTKSAVARALTITPQSVHEWFRRKEVPELQQLRLEKLTAGVLVASDSKISDDTSRYLPVTVMLNESEIELAAQMGGGNRSKGVRAALRIAEKVGVSRDE